MMKSGGGSGPDRQLVCGPPIRGLDGVLRPGRIVLFGEIHGTKESPDFLHDVVCESLRRGQPTLVALEMPATEQEPLAAFLRADDEREAIAGLLRSEHWTGPWKDGRNSLAMLDLLRRVREYHRRGHPVRVAAFDRPSSQGGVADREKFMADRLGHLALQNREAVVLVLSGNLHTRTTPHPHHSVAGPSMAALLQQRGFPVVNLALRHSGGTAWFCAPACGVAQLPARHPRSSRRQIVLSDNVDGHQGTYDVGQVHASPPAVPEKPRG
jgi:hypothetical protein